MNRRWRRWACSGGLLALLVVAAITRRDDVVAAAADLRTMAPGGAALLVAATAVHVVVRVRSFAVTVPGLSSGRAFVASEAGVAASSSLIGGGMVAAGLKTSMLRSWAVAPEAIAVSFAATGVATSAATWSLAIAVSAASLVGGAGTAVHAAVTVAGGVIVVAAGVFWAFVLCHDGTGWRVVWLGERTLAVVRKRWRACPDPDVAAWFGRGRHCGRQLVGTRGLGIFGLTVLSQVLLGVVLVVAVGVVGVRGPSMLEVFTAFALVRVLATLAPLPGGLGVTEVGLSLSSSTPADQPQQRWLRSWRSAAARSSCRSSPVRRARQAGTGRAVAGADGRRSSNRVRSCWPPLPTDLSRLTIPRRDPPSPRPASRRCRPRRRGWPRPGTGTPAGAARAVAVGRRTSNPA